MKRHAQLTITATTLLGLMAGRAGAGGSFQPVHYLVQGTDNQGQAYVGDVFVQANQALWGDYAIVAGDLPFSAQATSDGSTLAFTVALPAATASALYAIGSVGSGTATGVWSTTYSSTLPAQDTWTQAPASSPLAPTGSTAVFNEMAGQTDIAFRYPVDGCYARAQLMDDRMIAQGITPGRVWSFAPAGQSIAAATPNYTSPEVWWGWHVASTIPTLQPDGSIVTLVIDPSLFDHAVTVSEWASVQHVTSYDDSTLPPVGPPPPVQLTAWGQPPLDQNGQPYPSAYWPEADPPEGADAQAQETMEQDPPLQPPLPVGK